MNDFEKLRACMRADLPPTPNYTLTLTRLRRTAYVNVTCPILLNHLCLNGRRVGFSKLPHLPSAFDLTPIL